MGETQLMMRNKAPFITFEGGEGSGKTTQIAVLYKKLLQMGVDVVSYREPGGTKGAESIRELLVKGDGERWTPTTEALLMSASRADLVYKRILPQLEASTWVLCDRFTDSTLAYQGYGHNLGYDHILALNSFTVGTLTPDLTFIFQINPELGLERTALREGGEDRFEKFDLAFHQRVEAGYEEVLKNNTDRCVAINALLDIDMISELIFKQMMNRFGTLISA
jgi:dTMP kinase